LESATCLTRFIVVKITLFSSIEV